VSLLEAIVLGIVQGLTEFLPISSSAHLRIVPAFAGWDDPGAAFTAVTQLGTLVAVLLYFRDDLWRILVGWLAGLRSAEARSTLESRMGWYLIVATTPLVVFGAAFTEQIETGARNLYLIGATMIALGLVLLLAEAVGKRNRGIEDIGTRDGILVGLAQAAALIPGVSRSGATLTAGLFVGLDRPAAARFSFLLSVPAVILSGVYEMRVFVDGDAGDAGDAGFLPLAVATVIAFVVGYLTIAYFLRFLQTHSTLLFVVYRVAVGVLVILLAAAGAIG
jgi:undecaprenyl-diphosphatase